MESSNATNKAPLSIHNKGDAAAPLYEYLPNLPLSSQILLPNLPPFTCTPGTAKHSETVGTLGKTHVFFQKYC